MRFGLRAILLIVAIVMVVLAVILDENAFDLMALGLAALASIHRFTSGNEPIAAASA